MSKYAIGVDYGTLSVRALMVDIHTGEEVATSIYEYPHGVMEEEDSVWEKAGAGLGAAGPAGLSGGADHHREKCHGSAERPFRKRSFGIGVDFTSSTVLPVKADKTPLCHLEEFKDEPHAYVKLWKHHGAEEEALQH